MGNRESINRILHMRLGEDHLQGEPLKYGSGFVMVVFTDVLLGARFVGFFEVISPGVVV